MNKLVKIAPIIVILAAAGSLFFVFKLDQMKKSQLTQIAGLNSSLNSANDKQRKTDATLAATKKTLSTTSNELAQANTDLQSTKAALEQKTQEADGLKSQVATRDQQLQTRTTELAAAKDTLQRIQKALQDSGFENVESVEQIKGKIQALTDENKVLNDGLTKMRDENQQLKDKIVDLTTTPVNTRGRVVDVEDRWNFLVLNIGEQQHVRKNTQFLIYRANKPVGSVQVLYVGTNTSVAEILPESRHGTPRVGDTAVH